MTAVVLVPWWTPLAYIVTLVVAMRVYQKWPAIRTRFAARRTASPAGRASPGPRRDKTRHGPAPCVAGADRASPITTPEATQ